MNVLSILAIVMQIIDFIDKAKPVLERVVPKVQEALKDGTITLDEIFEIVGAGLESEIEKKKGK